MGLNVLRKHNFDGRVGFTIKNLVQNHHLNAGSMDSESYIYNFLLYPRKWNPILSLQSL